MDTCNTSAGVDPVSWDVILYQKERVAEDTPEGIVTVWYILPIRLLPEVPSGFAR
jgi:hypothetical protein